MIIRILKIFGKRVSTLNFQKNQQGFTLIELLIAIAVGLLVMSGVFEIFTSQQKSYIIQNQVTEMQQNGRAGLDYMVRAIRMAGYDSTYDLTGSKTFGFTFSDFGTTSPVAVTNAIYFTKDSATANGTIDNDFEERVGFRLNGTDLELASIDSGTGAVSSWTALAENIQSLTFTYVFEDETEGLPDDSVTDHNYDDVRFILIEIIARTAREDPRFVNPDDGTKYRTRSLTARVKIRNLSY